MSFEEKKSHLLNFLQIIFYIYMKIVIGYLVFSTEFEIILLGLFSTVFSKMAQSLSFLRDKIWVTSYLLCDVLLSVTLIRLS